MNRKWLVLINLNFTLEGDIRVIEVLMKLRNWCIDMDYTGKRTTLHNYNEKSEVCQQIRA